MKEYIQKLANEFLNEAKSSPRMFEDLAAMEHYMAESYNGRTLIELLQNADDAGSSSMCVFLYNDAIVVANNGRPFNKADLVSICRSGASSKSRGSSIGYRGVGFKSATILSSEIKIYSNNVLFTFSKSRCADQLGISVSKVPTVRIPFPIPESEVDLELLKIIKKYETLGYNTFFIFENAKKEVMAKEIKDITFSCLLFLNNIEKLLIDLPSSKKEISLSRKSHTTKSILIKVNNTKEEWLVISERGNAVAFKYSNNHITACTENEGVFHCFLPTLDSSGFPFKINADFTTDPSRKHIILNDSITKNNLENIVLLFTELFSDPTFEAEIPYLVDILCTHIGLSEASAFLSNAIISQLKNNDWLKLNNGQNICPSSYKLMPSWFDENTKKIIISTVSELNGKHIRDSIYNGSIHINELLERCGCQWYGYDEYKTILSNIEAITKLDDKTIGKIWGYMLRLSNYSEEAIKGLLIKDSQNKIMQVADINSTFILSNNLASGIKAILSEEEIDNIVAMYCFHSLYKPQPNTNNSLSSNTNAHSTDLSFSKWKSPIQNCIIAESLKGNATKDVSKKKYGYDVLSTDKNGEQCYIAVKSVSNLGDSFSLSELEHIAAEQFNSHYKVCIIEQEHPERSTIIDVKSINLEKRIKEWEWLCDSYEFEVLESEKEDTSLDANFIKNFSLQYLNKIQIAFLSTIINNKDINTFETTYCCKAELIAIQINSICDFYVAKKLIVTSNHDYKITDEYFGSIKYLLKKDGFIAV